jgi:hypothetical protein
VPEFLSGSYERALAALPDAVAAHRHEPWDHSMTISASAALAVAKGHLRIAEALMLLTDDIIERINRGEID